MILAIGQQADLSFLNPADGVELTRAGSRWIRDPGYQRGGHLRGRRCGLRAAQPDRGHRQRQAGRALHELSAGRSRWAGNPAPIPRFPLATTECPRTTSTPTPGCSDHADRPAHRIFRSRDRLLRTGSAPAGGAVPFGHPDPLRADKCVLCAPVWTSARETASSSSRSITGPGREPQAALAHYGASGEVGVPLSAMIKDDDKCIRCGLCAIRCPTDAMTMEVFFYEESEAACK